MHTVGWGGRWGWRGRWVLVGGSGEGRVSHCTVAPWRRFLSDHIRSSGGLEKSSGTGPQMLMHPEGWSHRGRPETHTHRRPEAGAARLAAP